LNRVLILAEGKEAKKFIESIVENYLNVAEFDVIYQSETDINKDYKHIEGINFYKIQFSAFSNLSFFQNRQYSKIIVVIKNRLFAINAVKSLKFFIEKNVYVEFVDFWDIDIENENINVVKLPHIINSTLIDLLPDVPVFARTIGLGKEEIMEVQVPVSSAFIYRNVELLNRENFTKWRISAIYRNEQLILPNKMTTIHPYDKLLIVGQSQILKDVFKSIKKDVGLFPEPYGNQIYLLIDKQNMNKEEISKLLKSAIYLQRKLKSSKLIIRIINPDLHTYRKLEKFDEIEVYIDYRRKNVEEIMLDDFLRWRVGMFVVNNKFYYKNIDFLLKIKKPFLKIGDESVKMCKETGVILRDDEVLTEISPVVFDISSQLNHKIKFLEMDPDNVKLEKKEIVKYYENLSKMYYYKNVEFIINDKNPYFELKKMKNICFFTPFDSKIPRNKLLSIILPNANRIQILMDNLNQFMIPTKG
jgi:hypothetical protein